MTNTSNGDNASLEMDSKAASQISFIEDAFRDEGTEIGHTVVNRGLGFMYEKDAILVRDEYLERVSTFIRRPDDAAGTRSGDRSEERSGDGDDREPQERVIRGVTRVSLRKTRFDESGPLGALREIDDEMGVDVATPNHVMTVCVPFVPNPVHCCPATEPEEVPDGIEPYPGVCPGHDGHGVRIFMADTGLLAGAAEQHDWLSGVEGEDDPLPDPNHIPAYTGHGTFVAGVARCVAPGADIFVANVFSIAGSALESQAVPKLTAALNLGVDIFHLTIATATRLSLPLLAFDAWRQLVRDYKGVVSVVAAGNSSSSKPFWPAAFPEMVSVGALAADWRSRANFSNHGGWVDVYAPGRDLVNAYATGRYVCTDDPYTGDIRHFYGAAKWSGTSFSAPIVTGLIAARMSRTGENAQEAAAGLLTIARAQAIPGVGAILRPCLDDNGPRCCPCGCGSTGSRGSAGGCGSNGGCGCR
jgi:subtilisin family serine protease